MTENDRDVTPTPRETRATGTYDQRDGLTGVRGRYTLLNDFEAYRDCEVFIALADVDNFRIINDAYGDNVGNELLREIGQTIMTRFGDEHTFRYGSDEFLIVCKGSSEDDNGEKDFLARLRLLAEDIALIAYNGKPLNLTCSYGYVHGLIASSQDLHEAIRFADRKMYEAKRLGKARVVGISLNGDPFLHNGVHSHQKAYKSYEIDELTGLANLVHFRNQLAKQIEAQKAPSYEDRLTVIFFNIQNFKGYNERFGFTAGDELLVLVAGAIEDAFPHCLASRTSADQYMVATTAGQVIDGIQQVRGVFRSRIKDSSIWLKAGYYTPASDVTNVDIICDRAKLACDAIKGRRDVFYRPYDAELERQIRLRHYILDHFDEALEKGYIKVYYQPIVRVATGEVCDEEALARWEDPQRGVLLPDDFIPTLEEARLIHRLDLYIVKRCCENLRLRMRGGEVRDIPSVSVNLSRLDFELCDIVSEIEKILAAYVVPHSHLSVEITESALIGNQEFLKGEIDRFRADGFEVWMDDFGSGYSSINLLKEYAFDLVKLDMGFLRGFEDSDDARILLANIIKMLKELGLRTLIEGVETEEQFHFMKGIGCGRAQGYLISRPRDLASLMRNIENGSYPPIERMNERSFYEQVGFVNLTRPARTNDIEGHYVASDSPAAILLRHGGKISYLNVTDVYRKLLRSIGIADVDMSERNLNDPTNPTCQRFNAAFNCAVTSDEWEDLDFIENAKVVHSQVRCIARHEETAAVGMLIIISSIEKTDPTFGWVANL